MAVSDFGVTITGVDVIVGWSKGSNFSTFAMPMTGVVGILPSGLEPLELVISSFIIAASRLGTGLFPCEFSAAMFLRLLGVCFLMLYEAGLLLKNAAARRTLVRLFRLGMRIDVLIQVTLLTKSHTNAQYVKRLFTYWAFVWLFTGVDQAVIDQMLMRAEALVTHVTVIRTHRIG